MQKGDKSFSEQASLTRRYPMVQSVSELNGYGEETCTDYMNKMIFSEQIQETFEVEERQRQGYQGDIFEQDYLSRVDFINSADFFNYTEMLVVVQIRQDFKNNEPYLSYIFNVRKAIHKAVRVVLIKNQRCKSKQSFIEIQSTLFRSFYQDISVGFITSTGQLKSTAYIFLNTSLLESMDQQQIPVVFKKQKLQITTFFCCIDYLSKIQSLIASTNASKDIGNSLSSFDNILGEQQDRQSSNQQTITPDVSVVWTGKSKSINDIISPYKIIKAQSSQKYSLPLSANDTWFKQAFIRTDKFRDQFIQIQKPQAEELKLGISIHFVYKPMDDQIYVVKRSCLDTQDLIFEDVFSTMNLQNMTSDHRKIREAKILSKLNHPNVLRLFDWWIEEEEGGVYALYMQLEYCSFPGFLNQTNDLLNFSFYYLNIMANQEKVNYIITIMSQIVDGLQYIHNRGIVHRDLKPENIFVSISTSGELQVMLADFDQGKDVREIKLSGMNEKKICESDLNSLISNNTIHTGTSGYQTPNSNKDRPYDQCDEFYALGVTLLHIIITFAGDPKNRNNYATTFIMSDIEDVLMLLDVWSNKYVKNKNKEFAFECFVPQLELAKSLIDNKVKSHEQIREIIRTW